MSYLIIYCIGAIVVPIILVALDRATRGYLMNGLTVAEFNTVILLSVLIWPIVLLFVFMWMLDFWRTREYSMDTTKLSYDIGIICGVVIVIVLLILINYYG